MSGADGVGGKSNGASLVLYGNKLFCLDWSLREQPKPHDPHKGTSRYGVT